MTRAYTLEEIDRMRQAIVDGGLGEIDATLRSYMQSGVAPHELERFAREQAEAAFDREVRWAS